LIKSKNILFQASKISRTDRYSLNGHKSCVVWFTGLSGSGKSTLAYELEKRLYGRNIRSYVLDGDNVRHGLCSDLGFSQKDRSENIRRIGEVSSLFIDSGTILIASLISPYRIDRQAVRNIIPEGLFVEAYVNCNIATCIQRDPKGLYKKALDGSIKNFTGISAPYETPENPEIILDTEANTVEVSVNSIINYLEKQGFLHN
jgi:adenylylsulfate kinase